MSLSPEWRAWVTHNVELGCSPEELLSILVEAGVDPSTAQAEITAAYTEERAPAEDGTGREPEAEAASEGLDHDADFRMEKIAPYIWYLDDVLDEDECALIINAARPRLRPCSVVVDHNQHGEAGSGYSDVRTGSAATFHKDEPLPPGFAAVANKIRGLVALLTNLPEDNQEPLEILHYAPGEYFNEHFDAFTPGSEYLKWEGERGGQRLFTFTLYLNDVAAGGEIEFTNAGKTLEARTGRAGFWYDMLDGAIYHESQHEAHPVTEGEKWVLTIWVRESAFGRPTPERQAIHDFNNGRGRTWLDAEVSIEAPDWVAERARTQQEKIPYLGAGGPDCRGFEKRAIPPEIYAEILEQYEKSKPRLLVETDPCVGTFVNTVSPEFPTSMFAEDLAFNAQLLEALKPMHEAWCGFELDPVCVYGFRVYLPGAYLYDHVDTPETHVVSSTVCVDRRVFEPWLFHVVDEDGCEHRVDIAPGELVLYESARILHGRPIPLNGQFYASLFVHYRPAVDTELWAASPLDWWECHRPR